MCLRTPFFFCYGTLQPIFFCVFLVVSLGSAFVFFLNSFSAFSLTPPLPKTLGCPYSGPLPLVVGGRFYLDPPYMIFSISFRNTIEMGVLVAVLTGGMHFYMEPALAEDSCFHWGDLLQRNTICMSFCIFFCHTLCCSPLCHAWRSCVVITLFKDHGQFSTSSVFGCTPPHDVKFQNF